MTRTIDIVAEPVHIFGDMVATIVDIDVTSYTTGGEALTAADVGLTRLDQVILTQTEALDLAAVWLVGTNLLYLRVGNTGVQLTSTGNGGTWRATCIGK